MRRRQIINFPNFLALVTVLTISWVFAQTTPPSSPSPTPTTTASPQATGSPATSQTIVDVLNQSGQYTMLVQALQAAGLDSTLRGEGPYTVFAPTDAAFQKLPPEAMAQLLQNTDQLRALLEYHVVDGNYPSAQLASQSSLETVEDESVTLSSSGGKIKVNDATITHPDIQANNGLIQGIDTVLVPSSVALAGTASPSPTTSPSPSGIR